MDDDDFSALVSPGDLKRRVTLDEYYQADIAHHTARRTSEELRVILERIERSKGSLASRALPGDEWWEWVQGTEPLMQSGGIALVRAGQIVYAQQHWIS